MPVNKEELASDLATPEYRAIVKAELAKAEFIVQDKTEHQQYLERVKAAAIETELPTKIKATHDAYDKDIKALFGVDRDTNEKSYDYLKRAATGKLTELEKSGQKIAELEQAIAKGDPNGVYAKQLIEAENKYRNAMSEKDRELETLRGKNVVTEKTAAVQMTYAEVKKTFKKQLPALFETAEQTILGKAVASSALKEGKLYMLRDDGTFMKDSQFREVPVEDWLKDQFKDVVETRRHQGGNGSGDDKGDPGAADPGTITKENFVIPATVKTRMQLMDNMLERGLVRGSKAFNEIWAVHAAKLPTA